MTDEIDADQDEGLVSEYSPALATCAAFNVKFK